MEVCEYDAAGHHLTGRYALNERGEPHGNLQWFYEATGIVRQEIHWENGLRNGPQRLYFPSGQLENEHHYQSGILTGPFRFFFADGQTQQTGHYLNGYLNGWNLQYRSDGSPLAACWYDFDNRNLCVEYSPEGCISMLSHHTGPQLNYRLIAAPDGRLLKEEGMPVLSIEKGYNPKERIAQIKIKAIQTEDCATVFDIQAPDGRRLSPQNEAPFIFFLKDTLSVKPEKTFCYEVYAYLECRNGAIMTGRQHRRRICFDP